MESTHSKSEILVLNGDDFKKMEDQYNKDTNTILLSSKLLIEAEKELAQLNAQVTILKSFCEEYLNTMEGIDDSDESFLSYEHKKEYCQAAKYMLNKFGRINNRIRQMEESNNSLPY